LCQIIIYSVTLPLVQAHTFWRGLKAFGTSSEDLALFLKLSFPLTFLNYLSKFSSMFLQLSSLRLTIKVRISKSAQSSCYCRGWLTVRKKLQGWARTPTRPCNQRSPVWRTDLMGECCCIAFHREVVFNLYRNQGSQIVQGCGTCKIPSFIYFALR
jgi:hypothetical protein